MQSELIKLLTELLALLRAQVPVPSEPEPEPEPEPRALRRTEQPGISMNEIARSIPRPKPPSRPGRQQLRHNGRWSHY